MCWDDREITPDVYEQMTETPYTDKLDDAAEILDDTDHADTEYLAL